MRFSKRPSVSSWIRPSWAHPSWTHAFPKTALRPALWALAITAPSLGLLVPEGLRAQVPQNVITQPCRSCESVHAADLDGDGDKDVLSASAGDNKIAWYENQVGKSGADSDGFGGQQDITTMEDRQVHWREPPLSDGATFEILTGIPPEKAELERLNEIGNVESLSDLGAEDLDADGDRKGG